MYWKALPSTTLLAAASLLSASGADPTTEAPTELHYTNSTAAGEAGEMVTTVLSSGERRVHFSYNDRGRGPSLELRLRTGERELPVSLRVEGSSYLGLAVEEGFELEGESALWKTASGSGSAPVPPGGAFYLSSQSLPEEIAALARALLASPDSRLPLIPAGEARLERVTRLEIDANEQPREISLYFIYGIDLIPTAIWLDRAGELFAAKNPTLGYTGVATIRRGNEALLDRLTGEEKTARFTAERDLGRRLRHDPDGPVMLRDVDVFDPVRRTVIDDRSVLIEGESILAVGGSDTVAGDTAIEIDATGTTLLPGLWDVHQHFANDKGTALEGLISLMKGVTSSRDLGGARPEFAVELQRRFDDGELAGPRLILSGMLDAPGPHQGPTPVLVESGAEVEQAIDRYASSGFAAIKLYNSFPPDLVRHAIDYAHRAGLPVTGHVPAGMTASELVDAGIDGIHHVNFLFLELWPEIAPKTNTPARFLVPAERAASVDLDSPRIAELLDRIEAEDVAVDPTLAVIEIIFTSSAGRIPRGFRDLTRRLPHNVQEFMRSGQGLTNDPEKLAHYERSFEAMLAMTRKLHLRGIPIPPGSDSLAGFALEREIQLYVEAGIPPGEVLALATLGAATLNGVDDRLGRIAPAYLADFILVEGDPLKEIERLGEPVMVVRGGRFFCPAEIAHHLGLSPPDRSADRRCDWLDRFRESPPAP